MEAYDANGSLKPADAGPPSHSRRSGNPVRIGDGCATVSGDKLPRPLESDSGKAGARFETPSQDIASVVLVRPAQAGHFSVTEKDEASPSNGFRAGAWNAFILR